MGINNKIHNRTAKIGVIGLGYVGLPLSIEFIQAGFKVVGIDIDKNKINLINSGKNYIKDVDDTILRKAVKKNKLGATTNFSIALEIQSIPAYSATIESTHI